MISNTIHKAFPTPLCNTAAPAATARDRLELKGITRDVAESIFDLELKRKIRHLERQAQDGTPALTEGELPLLKGLTSDAWVQGLQHIVTEQPSPIRPADLPLEDASLELLDYMRMTWNGYFGFPSYDIRAFLRFIVDLVPGDTLCVYDMSDLGAIEFEDNIERLVDYAEQLIDEDFLARQRTIVLTEGKTDRQYLMRSLNVLRPHLRDYFHFFDFDSRKLGGGAGELANLVRAFVAADVKHRILALFDNDTAGRSALASLHLDTLPDNVQIRHYPELVFAREYPTLGPSGTASMNVNGMACSIELYLGSEVLREADGALTPVQWQGFDQKQESYQGTIRNKSRIARAFERKLEDCERSPENNDSYDWIGIEAIILTMTSAFNTIDEELILEERASLNDTLDNLY